MGTEAMTANMSQQERSHLGFRPEARRKLELEAAVARLQAEILELDQSLELMERETEAQGDPWG